MANSSGKAVAKAEEVTVRKASSPTLAAGATCREAAEAAYEMYDVSEVDKHAQIIGDAWKAKLLEYSKLYTKQYLTLTRPKSQNGNGETTEAAEPITMIGTIPYQWWNMLLAGPFQAGVPTGPFLPQKIIRHGEPAFLLAAVWRNPAPLGGGPSAAAIMSSFTCQIRIETMNLSIVADGPDFVPASFVFAGGNVNIVTIPIPPAGPAFPVAPAQGQPQLYEVNATMDILGPGTGLPPFAGFSTAVFDPDIEPPFLFPFIPGIGPIVVPGLLAHLERDTPLRFLRYS